MGKKNPLLTGVHFLSGDMAIAEGALAAGCRFFAGYPITPATEVAERMAERLPEFEHGFFVQMEDEMASMNAVLGASWGGMKSMSSTSGPGFSLMMENIGLGVMLETPCVIANVQRAGPSTGLPTLVGQQDMMQVRWGSHGDYEIIALSPNSPQECYDFTIIAFNFAEEYRVPVFIMTDESVGHMFERIDMADPGKVKLVSRPRPKPGKEHLPYKYDEKTLIPPMGFAGEGHNLHVTGLTHDERGYPVVTPEVQDKLVKRLVNKIKKNAHKIIRFEENQIDDADIVLISFGISSRIAMNALIMARKKGLKVGLFRLMTVWPFPEERIRELAERIKGFVVVEINLGQMVLEVERVVAGRCKVELAPNAGGRVHEPSEILSRIKEISK